MRTGAVARPALFPTFDGDAAAVGATTRSREGEGDAARSPMAREAELEALRAQGFEAGCLEGREAGRTAAYAEWSARLHALVGALEGAVRALSVRRLELAAEVERRLPELALALGEKIVRQELRNAATAAQTVIRGMSDRVAGCGRPLGVRLAPQVVETFEAWRASTGTAMLPPNFRVEPDPTLAAGEWLLETDDGFLDGRIESQIESAWRAMRAVFD